MMIHLLAAYAASIRSDHPTTYKTKTHAEPWARTHGPIAIFHSLSPPSPLSRARASKTKDGTMSAAKFFGDDHAPGINFTPDDEELVELYLLPRVRGEPDPFPGLIIDDNEAATTQPWTLFSRHHLPQKDALPAFFYVRTPGANPDARPVRRCDGGGSWKIQKTVGKNKDECHALLVGGEKIRWIRHNLNFDMGSGSIGWVMREYSIPDHPSLQVCRISFSGHGQKRTRVPNDSSLAAGKPATKRARVAAAADYGGSASWTTTASSIKK
jgi:hypothetical protein